MSCLALFHLALFLVAAAVPWVVRSCLISFLTLHHTVLHHIIPHYPVESRPLLSCFVPHYQIVLSLVLSFTALPCRVESSPVQSSPVCTALPCRVQSSPFLSYIALPCPVQFCLVPHYPVVSSSFQFCPVPHYFVESSLVDYRPVLSRQVCGHHGWWCSTHECFQDMKVLKSTVLKREGAGGET
jgi:hypothetical protein